MFVQRLNTQNQAIRIVSDGLSQAQVNVQSSFLIHAYSIFNRLDEVKIIAHPSEYSCQIEILDNHDGTWMVNYTPKEIGQIQIDIFFDEKPMNTIPYKINVFDINQIQVAHCRHGFLDQLVKLSIDTSKAGIGQLEIAVEDGQVACDVISRASSQYDVTFLPPKGGLYKIDIRFNGLIIPGSPFTCSISDLSRVIISNRVTNVHVGRTYSFEIHHQSKFFDIHILAPSGRLVSFQRSSLNENQTRIDYILDEIGG